MEFRSERRSSKKPRVMLFQRGSAWEHLASIERARDLETIKKIIVDIASSLGFFSVFSGLVPSAGFRPEPNIVERHLLMSTMPAEWWDRYVNNNYISLDPIVQNLRAEQSAFTWKTAYSNSSNQESTERIRGEASEFGLMDGFVVPVMLTEGRLFAVSFGARMLDLSAEKLASLSFLTNFAVGHLINLCPHFNCDRDIEALTPRERDCLAWAADGKTDWEIATILGISVPTVRKHLGAVRSKLRAVNKYHAVAVGFRTGLLK